MKPSVRLFIYVFILSVIPYSSTLYAQGSLTPPGAPAPTMKSLDQIEARAPISSAPFTITQPGSYYLTTNLTVAAGNAITVSTNGVTIDLCVTPSERIFCGSRSPTRPMRPCRWILSISIPVS